MQRTNSFNEQVLSRASSTEKSGRLTDQVVGGAADGSGTGHVRDLPDQFRPPREVRCYEASAEVEIA